MRAGWLARGTVAIRLGRPHFAFYRGYFDGLDIGQLADRYLAPTLIEVDDVRRAQGQAPHVDLRLARSMVVWIRAQLQVAAKRSLGAADARLLRVTPTVLRAAPTASHPTLEQFREEHDPDGLFAEQELLALFAQAYPQGTQPTRQAARNLRLRTRQQHALARLEQLVGADPRLQDPVAAWLDAKLAQRLEDVDIISLEQLHDFIDRYGYRWYCKVPRIGLQAALLIAEWLQQESVCLALGRSVPLHARKPPRALLPGTPSPPPRSQARGLLSDVKRLRNDPAMNGSAACNRGIACRIEANDDWTAIQAWLTARGATEHMLRAYQRESERFLLWSLLEQGKPLSALDSSDCDRYRRFLAMLGQSTSADWASWFRLPQQTWIAERGAQRSSAYWRPFRGALNVASQKQSLVIIQSLMHWLFKQQYLVFNPFEQIGRTAACPTPKRQTRMLAASDWKVATDNWIDPAGRSASFKQNGRSALAQQRLRCILLLAYHAGLRVSELTDLRRRHLVVDTDGTEGARWMLRVTGRAGALRMVPMSPSLVSTLSAYIDARGLRLDSMSPAAPLIAAIGQNDRAVTAQRIYVLIKSVFADAAAQVSDERPEHAARLRNTSPQWLRHSFAARALEGGTGRDVLRDLLGHRTLETSAQYLELPRKRRVQTVNPKLDP